MKVKLKTDRQTIEGTAKAGTEIEVSDTEAARMIDVGIAEKINKTKGESNG